MTGAPPRPGPTPPQSTPAPAVPPTPPNSETTGKVRSLHGPQQAAGHRTEKSLFFLGPPGQGRPTSQQAAPPALGGTGCAGGSGQGSAPACPTQVLPPLPPPAPHGPSGPHRSCVPHRALRLPPRAPRLRSAQAALSAWLGPQVGLAEKTGVTRRALPWGHRAGSTVPAGRRPGPRTMTRPAALHAEDQTEGDLHPRPPPSAHNGTGAAATLGA